MPDDEFSFLPLYDVEAFCLYPLLHLAARVRESEVQIIDREKFQNWLSLHFNILSMMCKCKMSHAS